MSKAQIHFYKCDWCGEIRPDVYCKGDRETCQACDPIDDTRFTTGPIAVSEDTWSLLMGHR